MPSSRKLRTGVIGAGRIGEKHAENLCTRIRSAVLAGIADSNQAVAWQLADRLQVSTVFDDYRALLAHPDIDAVLICSATDTHASMIQEAARAGKHIFCEKPVDLDLDRIVEVLEVVARHGVKFQVGFNRRFDPDFKKIYDDVAGGRIGDPHIVRITSRDPHPPSREYLGASGGLFMDMTIHDFDMARYLIGSEPEEIFAAGAVLVDPIFEEVGDIDTALISIRFKNGALASIDNSRKAVYGYDQRVEVFGSRGMVFNSNRLADQHLFFDEDGAHSARLMNFFIDRYAASYVAEVQSFVDAVLNDTEPPVTGYDGLVPMAMAVAAQRSHDQNRPVLLSEIWGAEATFQKELKYSAEPEE